MQRTQAKRRIEAFEPCGPVAAMIDNETRSKGRGSKTRFFEDSIIAAVGKKYPKLAERFKVLREESSKPA